MDRLNYFNSYSIDNENQLTRAYLVLLKHSFHAFALFFDYVRSKHDAVSTKDEKPIRLNNLLEHGWEIQTQKGNPLIASNWLLSVLITDAEVKSNTSEIAASDRNAVYDGIISFGTSLTMIIENKPRSNNIWFGQLNPSRENLAEETKAYCNAAHLEWKEIIKGLNHLLNIPSVSGYEKIMIDDFLTFIDRSFPYLNPFEKLHRCKGYPELIYRRIQNVLKSIVINEEVVKYHQDWGFYIETPYDELKKIALVYNSNKDGWWLEVSFYFGDTQNQSKAFYIFNPTIEHLGEGWWWDANFHVAYQRSSLVWFKGVADKIKYIQFWRENVHEIYQRKKADMGHFFHWLEQHNIITPTADEREKLNQKFYNTAIPTLNICPGFGAVYEIEDKNAEELDRQNQLEKTLIEAIKDGLKISGKTGNEFLKIL